MDILGVVAEYEVFEFTDYASFGFCGPMGGLKGCGILNETRYKCYEFSSSFVEFVVEMIELGLLFL